MKLIPSKFTQAEFTEEELVVAKTFGGPNLFYLQHLRGQYAEQKLKLKFDPHDTLGFAQQEAELQGRIDLLTTLIGD